MIRKILKKTFPEEIKRPLRKFENNFLRLIKIPGYSLIIFLFRLNSNKSGEKEHYFRGKYFVGRFISFNEYSYRYPDKVKVLFREKRQLGFAKPIFDDFASERAYVVNGKQYEQFAATFQNALIFGNSSAIGLEHEYVLYDLKSHDTEKRYRYTDGCILHYDNVYAVLCGGKLGSEIDEAIWMGGNFSWNYYHYLYEFLAKFDNLTELHIDQNIPIVIDRICLDIPQFNELLSLVNTQGRIIVAIDKGYYFKIKKLYYINCPNLIPPNFKNDKDVNAYDLQFDVCTLDKLRALLLKHSSGRDFPKRIFLTRKNASSRRVFNEPEVISLMTEFGFSVIAPEEYSIADQISLFSQAEVIAGGSGAAFTNIIYCNKNAKVIIFTKNTLSFSGFCTLTAHIGADMRYITEEATKGDKLKDIHDPFQIDLDHLKVFLLNYL